MNVVTDALRIASTIACAVVVCAFVLWATDEGRASSDSAVARLSQSDGPHGVSTAPAAGPAALPAPAPEPGGVRGAIEDANGALLSPFDGVAQDGNEWAAHGIPALLALFAYGLLARVLIPYLPGARSR